MSRRPVARKKLAWRVLWDTHTVAPMPRQLSAASNASLNTSIVLLNQAEVEDFDDLVTVKRVVGEIHYWFIAQDGMSALQRMSLEMGMCVVDGSFVAGDISTVGSGDAQDQPWSWLSTWYATGSGYSNEGGNMQGLNDSYLSRHIDVRVNRRLKGGDELLLYLSAYALGAAWDMNFAVNLRMLCES